MRIIYCAIMLVVSNTWAGLDSSIQIRGDVSKHFKSREFISIKDKYNDKAYVVPRKNVRYLNKRKTQVFIEMTDSEFRSARKRCMQTKQIKRSLCPPKI